MTTSRPRRLRSFARGAVLTAAAVGRGFALPEVAFQTRVWRDCQVATANYRAGLAGGQSGTTLSRLEREQRTACPDRTR